jgi:hypothetical protein
MPQKGTRTTKEESKNIYVLLEHFCGVSFMCLFVANFAEL